MVRIGWVLDALVHPRTQGKVPMRHPFSLQRDELAAGGTNRREFIKIITMAAASVGLTTSAATRFPTSSSRGSSRPRPTASTSAVVREHSHEQAKEERTFCVGIAKRGFAGGNPV
jgi:hypothetical protein